VRRDVEDQTDHTGTYRVDFEELGLLGVEQGVHLLLILSSAQRVVEEELEAAAVKSLG